MKSLKVSSFGPIRQGEVRFGDLTVLVGPQASGKSLFVQLFKAIEDSGAVRKELQQYGFDWSKDKKPIDAFLSTYLGGGMASVWRQDTSINVDGKLHDFERRVIKSLPGRRGDIQTVIIEEPEMGLHPQAIVSFSLLMLELLWRGYRVILSTHSPVVLDIVWALKELAQLEETRAVQCLKKIFGVGVLGQPIREVFASALKKDYRVYFFDRTDEEVDIRDISSLDPGDDDAGVSGWGGLSGFSGRTADILGDAMYAESVT